jgi:F0F1-type ATP synthase assembly protein I
MVKNPGWENPLSDDWVSSFQRVLESANVVHEERRRVIEAITAMKLAGISRQEAWARIAADLVGSGHVMQGALFGIFFDEVYGEEVKEETS